MLVVVARNGLLFLVAWEIMSLASFFLVTFEYEKPMVRQAGWIYLIATHIGTAFLIVFFILLGRQAGSLDFDKISAIPSSLASILFLLGGNRFWHKGGFYAFARLAAICASGCSKPCFSGYERRYD